MYVGFGDSFRRKEFICRNWEMGRFKYASVQDRALKLYLAWLQKEGGRRTLEEYALLFFFVFCFLFCFVLFFFYE